MLRKLLAQPEQKWQKVANRHTASTLATQIEMLFLTSWWRFLCLAVYLWSLHPRVRSICGPRPLHTRHVRVVLDKVADVELGTTHANEVDDHLDLEAETDHAHDNSCKVYMAWRVP